MGNRRQEGMYPYINALSDSEVRRDYMVLACARLPHDAVVFFGVGGFIIVAPQKLARGEWRVWRWGGIKKGTARRGVGMPSGRGFVISR